MSDRKLASIQRIVNIQPIENADSLELATVLGWHCVVKKEEFKVGDLVVYIEPDSILPARPEFEFLRPRKFRIKTIKLRGQVSQGLVMSLLILPEGRYKRSLEGTDVTEILDIKKYDPQAEQERIETSGERKSWLEKFLLRFSWYRRLFPKTSGSFPSWIKKTDEERIQNLSGYLEEFRHFFFSVSEKLDGQSATFFLKKVRNRKYEFGVCSKNLRVSRQSRGSYWKVAEQLGIENVLRSMIELHDSIVFQGEIVGTGIQKNKYNLSGYAFYLYNIIIDGARIDPMNKIVFLNAFGIKTVPILETDFLLPETIDACVELSNGESVVNPNILREGLVFRNYETNISFKVINPYFLLKNDE